MYLYLSCKHKIRLGKYKDIRYTKIVYKLIVAKPQSQTLMEIGHEMILIKNFVRGSLITLNLSLNLMYIPWTYTQSAESSIQYSH